MRNPSVFKAKGAALFVSVLMLATSAAMILSAPAAGEDILTAITDKAVYTPGEQVNMTATIQAPSDNLLINGDFENGLTGWSRAINRTDVGVGVFNYTIQTNETNYLRLNKDYWGTHQAEQYVNFTSLGMVFSGRMRAVSLPSESTDSAEICTAFFGADGSRLAVIVYYWAPTEKYQATQEGSDGALFYTARVGNAVGSWVHVSYNIKEILDTYMPSLNQSRISTLKVALAVTHAATQDTSTADFDDMYLGYTAPNLVVNGDFESGTVGWAESREQTGTFPYSVQTNETNYLRVGKDYWGMHQFKQVVSVAGTDLFFSGKIRPVSLSSSGTPFVGLAVFGYDSSGVRVMEINHYFAPSAFLPAVATGSDGAQVYSAWLGNATGNWSTVSYNVQDILGQYVPSLDQDRISMITIGLQAYQSGSNATANADFDDIYLDCMSTSARGAYRLSTASAKLPTGRFQSSAVWDGANAYLFGGCYDLSGYHSYDQILMFNSTTGNVATLSSRLPSGRTITSAVWDGSNAYIFGGVDSSANVLDDMVRFTPSTGNVTKLSSALPLAVYASSAIWDGSNAYIFGGWNSDSATASDSIVRFNPTTANVTVLSAKLPCDISHAQAIWDGSNAYIFGGCNGTTQLDSIIKFNPATETVSVLPAKLPGARYNTLAAWDGTNAYIFGGYNNTGGVTYDDILQFDPATGTVAKMPSKLPIAMRGGSAVSNGTVYIFGGVSASTSILDNIMKFVDGNYTGESITFEVIEGGQSTPIIYTNETDSNGVTTYTFTVPQNATDGTYRVLVAGPGGTSRNITFAVQGNKARSAPVGSGSIPGLYGPVAFITVFVGAALIAGTFRRRRGA